MARSEGVGKEVPGRRVDEERLLEVVVVRGALVAEVRLAELRLALRRLLRERDRVGVHLAPALAVARREVRRVAARQLGVVLLGGGLAVLLGDLLVARVRVRQLALALELDRGEDVVDLRDRCGREVDPALVEVAGQRDDLARAERAWPVPDLPLAQRIPVDVEPSDVPFEAVALDPRRRCAGAAGLPPLCGPSSETYLSGGIAATARYRARRVATSAWRSRLARDDLARHRDPRPRPRPARRPDRPDRSAAAGAQGDRLPPARPPPTGSDPLRRRLERPRPPATRRRLRPPRAAPGRRDRRRRTRARAPRSRPAASDRRAGRPLERSVRARPRRHHAHQGARFRAHGAQAARRTAR